MSDSYPEGPFNIHSEGLPWTLDTPEQHQAIWYTNYKYVIEGSGRAVEQYAPESEDDDPQNLRDIFSQVGSEGLNKLLTHQAWWSTDDLSSSILLRAIDILSKYPSQLEIFTEYGRIALNLGIGKERTFQNDIHINEGSEKPFITSLLSIGDVTKWEASFPEARTRVRYYSDSKAQQSSVCVNVFGYRSAIRADSILALFSKTASERLIPYYPEFRAALSGYNAISSES